MCVLLDGLLPRLFPGLPFQCVPHEGKHDLERSIPRKLREWREPGVRFAVVRDNDRGDCRALKKALLGLCKTGRRPGRRSDPLIRIVCQELEAWYLGEPDALAEAFGREELRALRPKARDSDEVKRPADKIERLVPEFQKVSGARLMARHLTRERNRSKSFQAFVAGIERIAGDLARSESAVDAWRSARLGNGH